MKTVLKTIAADMKDEQGAHDGYTRLAKRLKPKSKMASISLLGIAKDEASHKKILAKLAKKVAAEKKAKKAKKGKK